MEVSTDLFICCRQREAIVWNMNLDACFSWVGISEPIFMGRQRVPRVHHSFLPRTFRPDPRSLSIKLDQGFERFDMSSSKVAQIRTYTIASPSSHTQPPNQQFSSSLPASSQSTPTTEVHSTCNYDAHKQRHQKRTKEDGRRFPTPRPRYNSDGKKVKQGGSYPYPSGGNRLPFLKKDDEDGTVLEEVGEVEVVSGCGQDHGRGDDRGRRDASTSTEMNMVKDKGKGKEKVEQKWRADDTRAEPHHNVLNHSGVKRLRQGRPTSPHHRSKDATGASPLNRGLKRDTTPGSTTADQALIRRRPSPKRRSHKLTLNHSSDNRREFMSVH